MQQAEQRREQSAVVIGGGLAGLSAATWLGRAGLAVTTLERRQSWGGRAATHQEQGFSLNQGPHALYRGGEAYRLLRGLGLRWEGHAPPLQGLGWLEGQQMSDFPGTPWSLLATQGLTAASRLSLLGLLARIMRLDTQGLESQSFLSWLEGQTPHADTRAALLATAQLTTYCASPQLASAAVVLQQLKRGLYPGVHYLDGGWQVLVEGLRQQAQAAGVKLLGGQRATGVEPHQGRWRVLRAQAPPLEADVVVVALPLGAAARLLGPRGGLEHRAAQALPVRMAALDVALRDPGPPRRPGFFSVEHALYASVHSLRARLAPRGGAVVHMGLYLPCDGEPDHADHRQTLEAALERLWPQWRRHVAQARYQGRFLVASALDTAAQGGTLGRAPVQVEGSPGLLLAGDWVGRRGLLGDASVASAQEASQAALAWLGQRAQPRLAA